MLSLFTHWKVVVSTFHKCPRMSLIFCPVSVAGSAIKWLRDGVKMISSAAEVNDLAAQEPNSGGLYFVTAFSGLLAPYWDPGAAGLLIGESCRQSAHIHFSYMHCNRDFSIYQPVPHRSCNFGS